MSFIPFEKLNYKTRLSPIEISELLNNSIANSKINGIVNEKTFKVTRVINYRNSFIPVCKGTITSLGSDESSIQIEMKPNVLVLIFISFFILFSGIISFILFSISDFNISTLIPLFMPIFAYLIITISFKFETKKIKLFFNELFNPVETNSPIKRH